MRRLIVCIKNILKKCIDKYILFAYYILMEKIVARVKLLMWVVGIFASTVIFIHTLAMLGPRMTKAEERIASAEKRLSAGENRISMIEIKLDELLRQSSETHKDVKDIYHLILERH